VILPGSLATAPFEQVLDALRQRYPSSGEMEKAIAGALESAAGPLLRVQAGEWIVRMVPVERLVPEVHLRWRPLVRDAMLFVVWQLSAARLAPKVVEQIELPPATPPEERLLRLIAKVPGLQKIGQVLARNRHLHPRLRRALSELENGISDVSAADVRQIVTRELGARVGAHSVELDGELLSEASVSAVLGFTWRNPESGRRERGVFKVLKPHIPGCYAEDMKILHELTRHLAHKHGKGDIRLAGLADTLTEIRLLLQHEVDFAREQATLAGELASYRSVRGVRVPRLIRPLCAPTITALTRERGVKVTAAFRRPSAPRAGVAERLAEALIAVPALAAEPVAVYHADPHAGNVLYDTRSRQLVILDWALTERLTREHRRNVLMLVLMHLLRDVDGVCRAVERLREHRKAGDEALRLAIRRLVERRLSERPWLQVPGAMDAVRLLDEIALEGVKFPAALLMFRKAAFTLEGVLEDIAGRAVRIDGVVARYAARRWAKTAGVLYSLLPARDWLALEWSALTFASRLCAGLWRRPWIRLPELIYAVAGPSSPPAG